MALSLEGIWKSYGAIKVLENVSLHIETGKSHCIIGRSGCGKSTLLKIIALMTRADRGNVVFDGININNPSGMEENQFRASAVSYSFQEPLLLPFLNALDNVVLVLGPTSTRKDSTRHLEDEARTMLSRLGLSKRLNHFPSGLSVGEKKRVDIARALVRDSKLLVADEPLSNLDPETGELVMELFKEYIRKGGTLVYSSVNQSESKYADEVFNLWK